MKLVRDLIPVLIQRHGNHCTVMQITKHDPLYKHLLIQKLLEEVIEFQGEGNIRELADVLEVMYALMRLPEYQEVSQHLQQKRQTHGQFDKGFVLMSNTKK
jgi:predicted house-cleaning noncanonical NTP pyrophosphatase (MazG superfamily)